MRRTLVVALAVLLFTVVSQANTITYQAILSGPNESPANASPGTGFALITYDSIAHTLALDITFSGLTAPDTASHIHCCTSSPGTGTAIVATTTPTFPGFPTGVTSGHYVNTLDLTLSSSYNPAFITAHGGTVTQAELDLIAGINADEAYLNIHTGNFPGGEIRGFLTPVPEPATMTLMAGGLIGLIRKRLHRSRR